MVSDQVCIPSCWYFLCRDIMTAFANVWTWTILLLVWFVALRKTFQFMFFLAIMFFLLMSLIPWIQEVVYLYIIVTCLILSFCRGNLAFKCHWILSKLMEIASSIYLFLMSGMNYSLELSYYWAFSLVAAWELQPHFSYLLWLRRISPFLFMKRIFGLICRYRDSIGPFTVM